MWWLLVWFFGVVLDVIGLVLLWFEIVIELVLSLCVFR